MERREWPVIVGGCHRSGTSLLRRILDAHARIHCGPEVKFMRDFFDDYHEDELSHLRYHTTARALVPEDELLEVLGRAFVELHERAARRAGKPRWADKAPENVIFTDAWERLLGDTWLFVHMVRNPLDTIASMKEAYWRRVFPTDLEGRIAFYRRYTEAGLEFEGRRPECYRRLVYEELIEAPQAVLAGLMEWAGEAFDPVQLAFNAVAHEPGMEDPKVEATTEIHRASLHRWPTVLEEGEAARIWGATRDLWTRIDPEGRYVAPPAQEEDQAATPSSR